MDPVTEHPFTITVLPREFETCPISAPVLPPAAVVLLAFRILTNSIGMLELCAALTNPKSPI